MIFGRKEDEVRKLIDELTSDIEMCLLAFSRGMESFIQDCSDVCEEERYTILTYEHRADTARREIQMKLYEGAFMPLYRDNIYMFIDLYDTIADETKSIVNTLVLERPHIPEDLVADYLALAKKTIAPFDDLKKGLEYFSKDKKMTLEATRAIEHKEVEVDKMEYSLRKKIFARKDIDLSEKLVLKMLAMDIADISDIIEDCSDLLEVLAVKRQI